MRWAFVHVLLIVGHLLNGTLALADIYGHRHLGVVAILLAAGQATAAWAQHAPDETS